MPPLRPHRVSLLHDRFPVGPLGREVAQAGGTPRSIDPGGLGAIEIDPVAGSDTVSVVPLVAPQIHRPTRLQRLSAGNLWWWVAVAVLAGFAVLISWWPPGGSEAPAPSHSDLASEQSLPVTEDIQLAPDHTPAANTARGTQATRQAKRANRHRTAVRPPTSAPAPVRAVVTRAHRVRAASVRRATAPLRKSTPAAKPKAATSAAVELVPVT
jgi:hypothetical protein